MNTRGRREGDMDTIKLFYIKGLDLFKEEYVNPSSEISITICAIGA
jgi:hypothetical protein